MVDGPAIGRQFALPDVVMAALVMEHEQAHAVGLLAQHARVEDEQAGSCGALTRQVPVGEDADVAAAHGAAGDLDTAAHGLLRGCLAERRGEPNTSQNDSHRNKRTR